jgi:integrase
MPNSRRVTGSDTKSQIEVAGEVAGSRKKVGQRRTRSPHPGVVILPPRGEHKAHRVRFTDPDSGRLTFQRIDPLIARTAEARRTFAIDLAKRLAKRRFELESGAPRMTGTTLADAVERYFRDARVRPRTAAIYRKTTDKLIAFAPRSADALTPPILVAFRAELARQPKRGAAKGGRRGASKTKAEPRAAGAVNVELRSIKVVLTYLRRLGLLPKISRDDITDSLKLYAIEHERGEFLRAPALRALLEAALEHDAETYALTRADKAAGRTASAVRRYQPIAPMVAAAMLTGMRAGELVSLEWSQIDLTAREIHLSAATKTKRARTIDLDVCPALAAMLERMKPSPARGSVFGLSSDAMKAAAKRLASYGAPKGWTWQALRRTCGTFLTCAPGIFGAASAYRSARQLGHSVAIAERHYVGVLRGIDPGAVHLETAMGIEDLIARIS